MSDMVDKIVQIFRPKKVGCCINARIDEIALILKDRSFPEARGHSPKELNKVRKGGKECRLQILPHGHGLYVA